MMKFFKFIYTSTLIFTSACSTSHQMPGSKVFSPENEGSFNFSLQGGLREFYEVTISSNNDTILATQSGHDVTAKQTIGFNGNLGLTQFLDLGMSFDMASFPIYYAKIQAIGKPRTEATESAFSTSLLIGFSLPQKFTRAASTISFINPQTNTMELNTETGLQSGIIFGYRTSQNLLLTTGMYAFWQTISGSHTLLPSNASAKFSSALRVLDLNFGAIFYPDKAAENNAGIFIQPSIQYGRVDSFNDHSFRWSYSADVGYAF